MVCMCQKKNVIFSAEKYMFWLIHIEISHENKLDFDVFYRWRRRETQNSIINQIALQSE